ncbi:MAG: deoxyribose-phosphate aldolase [Solobacterium sp.]|nr:deoxyribose-phosphate aldolase [Solobacterium sp.]
MKRSKYIDSTILKADATEEMIRNLCREAKKHDFAAVCVNPCWVSVAAEELEGTDVHVACVAGFPLGQNSSVIKAGEAAEAVHNGADEIDMVINIGRLISGDIDYVRDEIKLIKKTIGNRILKVIIECCLLNDEQKIAACKAAVEAGADYVKTSTGFSAGGATVEDVRLMKETVGDKAKVKAAGGIRTKEQMDRMIEAGAERIGTSSGASLL